MIDSGQETHVTKFLSSGIKPLHRRALKTMEMKIGVQIERVAKESCRTALIEEAWFTCPGKARGDHNLNSQINIDVSCDAGWQRQGSRKSYSSLSGHETLTGAKSGKIIDYGTRIKQCRICDNASRKAKVIRKHNCQKNWDNTAKLKEADMAVSMVKRHTGKEVQVSMDNDATTASKLKKEIEGEISEMKDLNYCKKNKNLRSHMEDLQRSDKELTFTYGGKIFSNNVCLCFTSK